MATKQTLTNVAIGGAVIIAALLGVLLLVPPKPATAPQTDVEMPVAAPAMRPDLITLASPLPNALIQSPLALRGEARGYWFFEASFPIQILDANGNNVPLSPSYATAIDDWMTTDFVPFSATLEFTAPTTDTGTLILKKDNPSDLPEHDDELRVPVKFR